MKYSNTRPCYYREGYYPAGSVIDVPPGGLVMSCFVPLEEAPAAEPEHPAKKKGKAKKSEDGGAPEPGPTTTTPATETTEPAGDPERDPDDIGFGEAARRMARAAGQDITN